MSRSAILIAGPTASGKSRLALDLAAQVSGEIVNADAMQVYRDLRVLTARPDARDEAAIPHHFYGVADGNDPYSAGRFAREAAVVLEEIWSRDRTPIIVGGTGLWLEALAVGLSPIPAIPDDAVAAAHDVLAAEGAEGLRAAVLDRDPAMARLEAGDTQRHLRALAVAIGTGRPLSAWQAAPPEPVISADWRRAVLLPDRATLHERAARRLDDMLANGALAEVKALLERNISPDAPVMKAVGVREFAGYLHGDTDLGVATDRALVATRQLIKRQTTWINNRFADWPRGAGADAVMSCLGP